MGQLLQQLAMADTDDGDPRRKSNLSKFDKVRVCVSELYGLFLIYAFK